MHFMSLNAISLVLLVCIHHASAAPINRNAGIVSLPLNRVRNPNRHLVDPNELHSMHANHAEKRLAKFLRREIPSDDEIIARRVLNSKRFDHTGVPNVSSGNKDLSLADDGNDADTNEFADTVTVQTTVTTTIRTLTTTVLVAPTPTNDVGQDGLDPSASDASSTATPNSESSVEGQVKFENIGSDVGYFAVVEIGTPPREFKILMDSGSADFWVGSEADCTQIGSRRGCGDHVFLGSSSSSTFQASEDPFGVVYGSGEVRGIKVTDNVSLAGLPIENLDFAMALQESKEFTTATFDGLMGFALSELSDQRALTPIEALAKEGAIAEGITSYKMSREIDGVDDGTITFGGLDESQFDPDTLVTFDNVDDKFWIGAIESVKVDGKELDFRGQKAILDTGTTLMLLPERAADLIHSSIPGARLEGERYTLPCDTEAVLSMAFGGRDFDIDPRDLSFFPTEDDRTRCTSGIAVGTLGSDEDTWLVGDVFLKSVYFSHNANTNKMQLAKLV